MKPNFKRLMVLSLSFSFALTGCQSANKPSSPAKDSLSADISHAGPAKQAEQPQSADMTPSANMKPIEQPTPVAAEQPSAEVVPKDFESGKAKEEPNVPAAGAKSRQSGLQPIYGVDNGTVAITIDDGPTKYTNELLKVLKDNDTKVTFFLLGQNAAAYPDSVIKAVYDGHEIGYHSNSHPKMTQLTLKQQESEFELGLSKLKKLDSKPIQLFRPPYGAYNNDTKAVIEEHNMNMVLWNEDPRDWATTDPAKVADNVLSQVHSGSIIVMHDRPSTIAALPTIINGIKKKGLRLVTIGSK